MDKVPRLFSSLQLDLPEVVQVQLGEISTLQRPFHVHHPGVSDIEEVWQYKCLIGQKRKLIQIGNFLQITLK